MSGPTGVEAPAVMDLDDDARQAEVDTADALADVEQAPAQWRAALEAGQDVRAPLDLVDHVVVCGMGGSGIVADVVAAVAAPRYDLPVVPRKSPGLPAWVGGATLVVAVSYSGNTAETLASAEEALDRGAPVLGITSGGRLAELLEDAGQPLVLVDDPGRPPRHSTGALLVPVLQALELDGDLDDAIARLEGITVACHRDVPSADNPAKQLALRLAGADTGVPSLYGTAGIGEVAAYRLRCQLAENAKMRASHHAVPELCHNESVAWDDTSTAGGVLWICEDPAEQARVDVLRDLFDDHFAWAEGVTAEGASPLERYASLVGLLDLVSVHTAIARGVDPTPIAPIDRIKAAL